MVNSPQPGQIEFVIMAGQDQQCAQRFNFCRERVDNVSLDLYRFVPPYA